jgi:hypothetical protein
MCITKAQHSNHIIMFLGLPRVYALHPIVQFQSHSCHSHVMLLKVKHDARQGSKAHYSPHVPSFMNKKSYCLYNTTYKLRIKAGEGHGRGKDAVGDAVRTR